MATEVEFAVTSELITNEVPFTMVPTLSIPRAAAPVAPGDIRDRYISELDVTEVVATVAVPETRVTEPKAFAPADVVVPTLVDRILFPDVPRTRLPFVAVMAPKVAVSVVVAAIEPGAMNVDGTDQVIVLPDPVVVIWFAVPSRLIFPADGPLAPPEPPVRVSTGPDNPPPWAHCVGLTFT